MKVRLMAIALAASLTLLALAGCSGSKGGTGAGGPENPIDPNQPLTLSLYQYSANLSDEEFRVLMAEPLKKKYPNVTLELVRAGTGTSPEQMVTAGTMPDIIFTGSAGAVTINKLKAAQDLNGLIKKYNMDINKFDAVAMDSIRRYSESGELFAIPFNLNFSALYYNKDVFDKFAVAYPKDGMRWDDAIELARRVTRSQDGVQYSGLNVDGGVQRLAEQLELAVVDPKTLKAVLMTDGWRKVADTYKRLMDIPGNRISNPVQVFEKDRTLAMLIGLGARLGELEELHNTGNPMNWDLATVPTFPEYPNNALRTSVFLLMLSSTSKYQEQAFQVMSFFTSEEVQAEINKRGRLTSLKDPKFRQSFGETINTLKGKNKDAIFKTVPAPMPPITLYDGIALNEATAAIGEVVNGRSDANTALRAAEDRANKRIEEQKNQ
jgi:multiple sugar transport system substrate-binding protein